MNVVTRFAPSPTGYLHIGSLRTVYYTYLLARKHKGTFVLRVEDTDRNRLVEGAIESLITTLDRVGLDYDEGPYLEDGQIKQKGSSGPYIQSERTEIYLEYAQKLLDAGHAYYCFCSRERLDEVRKQQQLKKMPTKYDRTCCNLTPEHVQKKRDAGEEPVVRMKIPEGETTVVDAIRGNVVFNNKEIDDQVLLKSDGFPTYHLAVVVDDHLMNVTHIIRGEEWLSSTPKHVILINWFGFDMPVFAHLPLILNADKSKLSKRQGDVAVEDFLEKGYLVDALLNFVALLGFNPRGDQEIYTQQELMDAFDLSKINKSGAIFDRTKLDWMNGQYIKQKTSEELHELVRPFLDKAGEGLDGEMLRRILEIEKDRMTVLSEINEKLRAYRSELTYADAILVWKKSDKKDAEKQLKNVLEQLSSLSEENFSSVELIEKAIKRYIEDNELNNGNVLWPLRVALSGQKNSPSPFELAWIFGKEETLKRITLAIDSL